MNRFQGNKVPEGRSILSPRRHRIHQVNFARSIHPFFRPTSGPHFARYHLGRGPGATGYPGCVVNMEQDVENPYLLGGLEHEFYDFPYSGNNNQIWRTHIFQRGRYTTNQIWFIWRTWSLTSQPTGWVGKNPWVFYYRTSPEPAEDDFFCGLPILTMLNGGFSTSMWRFTRGYEIWLVEVWKKRDLPQWMTTKPYH